LTVMLEGAFFRVLSINAPRGLRCVSDDVSNLPQPANDQQLQAAGARPLGCRCTHCRAPASPAPMVFCLPTRAFFTTLAGHREFILAALDQTDSGPCGAVELPITCTRRWARPGFPLTTRWLCPRSNVEVTCNRARRFVRRAPRLRLSG